MSSGNSSVDDGKEVEVEEEPEQKKRKRSERAETVENAARQILGMLHVQGSATVAEIHKTLGISLRRCYDIVNCLCAVPCAETPLVKRTAAAAGGAGHNGCSQQHRRFALATGMPWPQGVTLENLEEALCVESRLVAILAERVAVLRAALLSSGEGNSSSCSAAEVVSAQLESVAAAHPFRHPPVL